MKIANIKKNSQRGFTLLHILPLIVVIAAIGFIGGSVYQAQQRKEAARIAEEAKRQKAADLVAKQDDAEEQKEVDIPDEVSEEKPVEETETKPTTKTTTEPEKKTEKSYTTVDFSSVTVNVNGDDVTVTGKLPASYKGTCYFKVKLQQDTSKRHEKQASLNGTTCTAVFSKATLVADGFDWYAAVSYNNSDYTVKGSGLKAFSIDD